MRFDREPTAIERAQRGRGVRYQQGYDETASAIMVLPKNDLTPGGSTTAGQGERPEVVRAARGRAGTRAARGSYRFVLLGPSAATEFRR